MPTSKVNIFENWKALFAAILLVFTAPALAQDADADSAEKAQSAKKKFERVEVTGSLIRRSDFEGPSPVEVIDRKALDETAYNSVADYVRDLPISSFGSARESSGSTAAGVSTINLRGLGSANTLVLLNGARLPIDGNAGAVNMNLIPEIIIDGVEILKDGASATYGSDAIGGVVAVKSRKNFTGTEVSYQGTLTEESGGARNTLGLLHGKQFGQIGPFTNASVTVAAQVRQNEKIFDRDREWSKADNLGIKGWSRTSSVPTYRDSSGDVRFIPSQCEAQNGFVENDGTNSYCRYAFADRSSSLPKIRQYSSYANVELEMGTRDRITITGLASRQETEWNFAPSPSGINVPNAIVIPGAVADTLFNGGVLPGVTPGSDVTIGYRTAALGDRISQISNDSYYIYSDYAHEFGDTWEWKSSVSYSSNQKNDQSPTGYALRDPFLQAVASGAFNPFDQNDDGSGLDAARYTPFQKTSSNSVVVDSRVNGELMAFGANEQNILGGAFGVQYIHSEYRTRVDDPTINDEVLGNAGSNGGGQRDNFAAYAEFGLNIGKMWEFQAAGRYDRFSDFGDTINPKVGIKFRPHKTFMLRASAGTAFKAPGLLSLYGSKSVGFPAFIDAVKCASDTAAGNSDSPACREEQYFEETSANPNLEEEKATSYGVGFIYEPMKGLSIGSDYWAVDQTNVIGIDYEEITKAVLNNGLNPADLGINIIRDPSDNSISAIQSQLLNLSERKQSGLDFQVSYAFKTPIGRFRVSDYHSQTFERLIAGFPGGTPRDFLDDNGFPKWRNTASVIYQPDRKNAITLNYVSVAGQKDIARTGARIPSYGELELSYTAQLPWWKGTTMTAGVRNLLGDTPSFDPNGGSTPFNPGLYSPVQRYGYLNLRHSF